MLSSLAQLTSIKLSFCVPTGERGGGGGGGGGGGVTRSYKEKANSNRPIGPYKAVRYLT